MLIVKYYRARCYIMNASALLTQDEFRDELNKPDNKNNNKYIREYVKKIIGEENPKFKVIAKLRECIENHARKTNTYIFEVVAIKRNEENDEYEVPFKLFKDREAFIVNFTRYGEKLNLNKDDYVEGKINPSVTLVEDALFRFNEKPNLLIKVENDIVHSYFHEIEDVKSNGKLFFIRDELKNKESLQEKIKILRHDITELERDREVKKQELSAILDSLDELISVIGGEVSESNIEDFDSVISKMKCFIETAKDKKEALLLEKKDNEKNKVDIIIKQNDLQALEKQKRDELKGVKNEYFEVKQKLEQLKFECTQKVSEKEQLNLEKNDLEQALKNLEENKKLLEAYDIFPGNDKAGAKKIVKKDIEELADEIKTDILTCIQAAIYNDNDCKWIYPEKLINAFLAGLYTNQIIVLCGKPGSGKSTFVSKITKIIGGKEAKILPVQSSWVDKTDLLGYFDPVHQRYIPTEFLRELISLIEVANENTDKLFFMCLDEMNLAFVEYYFADFLSKLQTEDTTVELYSKEIYDDAMLELKKEMKNSNDGDKEYLVRKLNILMKYPNEIKIPSNIKFIGTINNDATTKDLSPKVIDRAYFIRMDDSIDRETFKDEKKQIEEVWPKMNSLEDGDKVSYYLPWKNFPDDEIIESIMTTIKKSVNDILHNELKLKDIMLNYRFEQSVKKMISCYAENQKDFIDKVYDRDNNHCYKRNGDYTADYYAILDLVICALVLPKIKCDNDKNNKRELNKKDKLTNSERILGDMTKDDYISYWI